MEEELHPALAGGDDPQFHFPFRHLYMLKCLLACLNL